MIVMVKDDLQYLEIHAGIAIGRSEVQKLNWRCLYTKAIIKFIELDIIVEFDNGLSIITVTRPYCPKCLPAAKYDVKKFVELVNPYPSRLLVAVDDGL